MAHAEYDADGLPIVHDEAPNSATWLPKLGIALFGVICAVAIVYVSLGLKAASAEVTPTVDTPALVAPAAPAEAPQAE